LLVKGVNHVNVPRGEHHSIGVAEKAIQDLSNMMRSMLADSNVSGIYWDFVIEHAALVNSMITPSISDKKKNNFRSCLGCNSDYRSSAAHRMFLCTFDG